MRSRNLIEQEAGRLDVSAYMEFRPYVPASEIPQILNQSALLLLLTNRADEGGPHGILTTKFFEYIKICYSY